MPIRHAGNNSSGSVSSKQVLDTIDNVLLPNAKHPKLKAALSDFRPPVAEHLQLARDIQGMLESETMRANAKSGGV